ncbi:hypothetical protein F2P56_031765 [Juglans regia]|uniref:Uncharacterized protein n=1 Tax=Juglans regia TaxID=51240 RepID=A0A833WUM0_JUGRE|nr:hypothetical protein F2P56_031765 [Juglans regia]
MKNDFNQHVLMLKFKSFSFGEDLSDTLLQIPLCYGIGTNVVGFGFHYTAFSVNVLLGIVGLCWRLNAWKPLYMYRFQVARLWLGYYRPVDKLGVCSSHGELWQ